MVLTQHDWIPQIQQGGDAVLYDRNPVRSLRHKGCHVVLVDCKRTLLNPSKVGIRPSSPSPPAFDPHIDGNDALKRITRALERGDHIVARILHKTGGDRSGLIGPSLRGAYRYDHGAIRRDRTCLGAEQRGLGSGRGQAQATGRKCYFGQITVRLLSHSHESSQARFMKLLMDLNETPGEKIEGSKLLDN
jgi:hypothetical protein